MNCFEWQTRISDYLDGTLPAELKEEAETHLSGCVECSEKSKHIKTLLAAIANQPRISLPEELQKDPFSSSAREELLRSVGRLDGAQNFWKRIPWYVKTAIEGSGIVLLILVGISAGPRLRKIYERSIERSVSEFNETFNDPSNVAESSINLPLSRQNSPEAASGNADEFVDEAAQSDNEDSADDSESDDLRAGSSEIWRFNVKTDSPHDFRNKVVQMLTDLGVKKDTPGLGGIEAPGGIQFDILINTSSVPNLKRLLQKSAPRAPEGLRESPMGETFSWFKNKSRRKIPPGKTRVVIWLSQM